MGHNRIKTVTAGRLVHAVCYSQAVGAEAVGVRQAKQKVSSAARQHLNFRAAWQKLELILAANFGRRDWWITLTYDDAHLPADRAAAVKEVGKFIRVLKADREKRGLELRYVYCTEEIPDEPGGERRLHHHAVINAADDPDELIEALWGRGLADVRPLLDSAVDGYEARARYLVKERHPGAVGRKTGLRGWSGSRNLKKPEVSSALVSDAVTIQAPPGAFVLARHGDSNCYGTYLYIKYLLPETPAPRPRRRT